MAQKFQSKLKIIIPIWNNLEFTKMCLDSLYESTKTPFELIIVDNGSTDGSPEYIKGMSEIYKNIRYIRSLENHGVTWAWNAGLNVCDLRKDTIAILNNDILLTPEWDIGLLEAIENGASVASPYYSDTYSDGGIPTDFPVGIQRHTSGWVLSGWCFMCRPGLFEEIGTFPPQIHTWSNDRFLASATDKIGGEMVWVPSSYIHHFYSQSISKVGPTLVPTTNNDAIEYDKICAKKGYKRF